MGVNTTVFNEAKDCCGCGACQTVCPKNAISMEPDAAGFLYPVIDKALCISCGLCQQVCSFQVHRNSENRKESNPVYALSRKDKEALRRSASGGVFAAFAGQWIRRGGVVFGAALADEGGTLVPRHVMASTMEQLPPLLGSKYVQSDISVTFLSVKQLLKQGKQVLYSGTPCQIGSLLSYLKNPYENLLTIDLVCHGVPSAAFFQEYLRIESRKIGASVTDYRFRDKTYGWGLNAKILTPGNSILRQSSESSYYELFLNGETYRDSCYHCPYAGSAHPADLTIGDYWGIEAEHPEYLAPFGSMDPAAGISMLMINSDKGQQIFEQYKDLFDWGESSCQKAARHNGQLSNPTIPGPNREKILQLYRSGGFAAVDRWFWKEKRAARQKEWVLYHIHNNIPEPVRRLVKRMMRR